MSGVLDSENLKHAFDTGLRKNAKKPKIERPPYSRYKLSPEILDDILIRLNLNQSLRSIGRVYNVNHRTISDSLKRASIKL